MICPYCKGNGKSKYISTLNCYGCKGIGSITNERYDVLKQMSDAIRKKIKEDYPELLAELYAEFPRVKNEKEI